MASYQYIYVMKGFGKAWPGGKKILENVWLSFYPGAKIGVLGVNGSGKSTLLKVMAGLDTDYTGEVWAAEGATVGYLPQEPHLDPSKNVGENVMQGLGPIKALVDRFTEVSMKLGEVTDDDEMNALIEEQGTLQEKSTRPMPGTLNGPLKSPWMRCAARLRMPMSANCRAARNVALLCVVCCCKSPTCCCWTSRPTIWTPVGGLVTAISARLCGHRGDGDA